MDDYLNKSSVHAQSRYHSAAGQNRRISEQLILADPEIKREWNYDVDFTFARNRAFARSDALGLVPHLAADGMLNLAHYLRATSWLLECLIGECYISKSLREDLYDDFLLI